MKQKRNKTKTLLNNIFSVENKNKVKILLKNLFSGEKYYSIILYIILVYLLFVYVALPSVYAFTPVSYISAVVSGSMEHNAPTIQLTYNDWLVQNGFNSSVTSSWPFQNGINVGSLTVAYKVPADQIKIGDVIIYTPNSYTAPPGSICPSVGPTVQIIHRVINETIINGTYYYTTKGDANPLSCPFEIDVPYSAVIGEVETVIPYLGYPRYILYSIGNLI